MALALNWSIPQKVLKLSRIIGLGPLVRLGRGIPSGAYRTRPLTRYQYKILTGPRAGNLTPGNSGDPGETRLEYRLNVPVPDLLSATVIA